MSPDSANIIFREVMQAAKPGEYSLARLHEFAKGYSDRQLARALSMNARQHWQGRILNIKRRERRTVYVITTAVEPLPAPPQPDLRRERDAQVRGIIAGMLWQRFAMGALSECQAFARTLVEMLPELGYVSADDLAVKGGV